MQLNRGIIYVAFGEEFDRLAAATAKHTRIYTDLPMCVLTNLKKPSPEWDKISNVFFRYLPFPSEENRRVKVSLIDYTPFDKTLFMDVDALIQKKDVERFFDYLNNYDIVCQHYGCIHSTKGASLLVFRTYLKLAIMLHESLPIKLYGEAAFLFNRTKKTRDFFSLWKKYWMMMGCSRDMPGFSFAAKHSGDLVRSLRHYEEQFCVNQEDERYFIQHKGFTGFLKKFGLPEYIDWNPKL